MWTKSLIEVEKGVCDTVDVQQLCVGVKDDYCNNYILQLTEKQKLQTECSIRENMETSK